MTIFINIIMLCGFLMTSAYAESVQPTVGKASAKSPAQMIDKDSECTRCHDENEAKPILSIYQTAHGNKADARTPGCQSCHG